MVKKEINGIVQNLENVTNPSLNITVYKPIKNTVITEKNEEKEKEVKVSSVHTGDVQKLNVFGGVE